MKLSRRVLLKLLATSAASIVVSSGVNGCFSDSSSKSAFAFDYGIASGDPLTDSVIIWTRVTSLKQVPAMVSWEVSTDPEFTQLVNSDSAMVDEKTDYTLKVDVKGLEPSTRYYYRFKVKGLISPVGQTKTLPINADSVKLAVFSCANFPAGFFHVYKEAAKQAETFDAVLHLGDYIYEYAKDDYPEAGTGEEIGRVHQPEYECITLSDYRQRYAQYHADLNLIELHAKAPFICVWDDHEIANDSYIDGAENHTIEDEGSFYERKEAAIQAWYEWLPVRVPQLEEDKVITYRVFEFGKILSLIMLDTRVIGRDQQLMYGDYFDAEGNLIKPDLLMSDLKNPDRNLLGSAQLSWLENALISAKSKGVAWQVLGQQVLMARIYVPSSVIQFDPLTGRPNPLNFLTYYEVFNAFTALASLLIAELARDGLLEAYTTQIDGYDLLSQIEQAFALIELVKVEDSDLYDRLFSSLSAEEKNVIIDNGNLLNSELNPKVPYNLDAWDGYDAERECLLQLVSNVDANLVVLSGDSHNGWCNYITNNNGTQIGVEFGTGSVSSPGLEKDMQIPGGYEAFIQNSIVSFVKDVEYCNSSQRGYLVAEFTENEVVCEWHMIEREAEKNPVFPEFELGKRIAVSIKDKVIRHVD
ncbi:alkaline phosphatase D family protein [Thiomicrorhabdus aquaedulcis]|uniref:alkaline phosphatase D family protein n=1 Tax=Thiomicrorhabdus aquaedulcis TaxID=2211106 RepID=UPI000FD80411|nr:alkaline phosphatase D family protein [Thiomicrorhabdus aquaedulcis]